MFNGSVQKTIFNLFISLVFLAGCSAPAVSTPTLKTTSLPIATLPAVALSTPTNQPSAGPSTSSQILRTQNCLSARDEVPLESVAVGTALFYDSKYIPYLLELGTHAHYDLPYEKNYYIYGPDTSPNHNYLAYMEGFVDSNSQPQISKIWVVNPKGNIVAWHSIHIKDTSPYWQWVNDDTIQFFTYPIEPGIGKEYLYKPFKRELVDYTKDLPMLYQGNYLNKSMYMVEYSPDLEWAIYLAEQSNSGDGPGNGPIVLDLSSNQVIWKAVGDGTGYSLPIWSPVGDRVAVVVDGKLYIVNRDGQVISPPGLTEDEQLQSEKFAWSPDGRYIAFWANRNGIANLMLYDVQDHHVIDYCIEDIGGGNSLIWSPDGTQFITYVVYQATEDTMGQYSLLVDIINDAAYRVPFKPLAWMNSEP